ncbi:MAG: hypothetical protein ACW98I_18990 [Candidatus Hodarchaeales archaeon]|jgi:hypothetical protein
MNHSVPHQKLEESSVSLPLDPFVRDICTLWTQIRHQVGQRRIRKISKTVEITQGLMDKLTLPFYEKYQNSPLIEYSPAWIKYFASISILWRGGRILFPLRFVTYELAYFQDQFLETYLEQVQQQKISGTVETFFKIVFPKLLHLALPLSTSDVLLLKNLQSVYNAQNRYSGPSARNFVHKIPNLPAETIRNKFEYFRYFQIAIPAHFLDMGKLGFETFLISHSVSLVNQLSPYCLLSVNLNGSYYSLIQLPYTNTHLLEVLLDFLARDESSSPEYLPMTWRTHSWNLSSLQMGKNNWELPYAFFHGDPTVSPEGPPFTMNLSLDPQFEPFRPLTEADMKLLSFLTTVGKFLRINDLAKQLELHRNTVVKLLTDYQSSHLLHQVVQYFNLGLDLPVYLYMSIPQQSIKIPFLEQCRTLPRIDLFSTQTPQTSIFFGRIDLPSLWCREFVSHMHMFREAYPEIILHYSFEPASLIRWNLSLSETYDGLGGNPS